VTGMDDIGLARFAVPSLTTVRVPQKDLGELAWQRLLASIAGSAGEADDVPELRLAVRASTGPVPQAPRSSVSDDRIGWQQQGDIFELGSSAGLLARYEFGRRMPQVHAPRPYLHPVRTLGGQPLTEASPVDHRHHYGVSIAVAQVNGTSHWGARTYVRGQGPTLLTNHGQQRSRGVTLNARELIDDITWYDEQGRPQLVERRRLTGALAFGGWRLDWRSVLTARYGSIRIDSPATTGREGAGYGGIFWRLPLAETTVLSADGDGLEAAFGSVSPWLAFVQGEVSLLLVQPDRVWPWFLRTTQYVGACPALAWDKPLALQPNQELALSLTAVLLDRRLDADEAKTLVDRL
jgi:LacI family transcriptional regulator